MITKFSSYRRFSPALLVALFLSLGFANSALAADPGGDGLRQKAQKQQQAGNFRDAYDLFRKVTLDPNADERLVGQDLQQATNCLQRLGRVDEIDAYREEVIKVHAKNWRLLSAAAQNYMNVEHYGFIVGGEFRRGRKRGGGKQVHSMQRDRVRALQLMTQAIDLTADEPDRARVAQLYISLSNLLLNNRGFHEAWRLQYATDLNELPDYEEGWYFRGRRPGGATVDADGNPVFYQTAKIFAEAENDGQRWRWALDQAVEAHPPVRAQVLNLRAQFSYQQFGVQTMAMYGHFFGRQMMDEGDQDESGAYALHTLGENETIARLATGIKRFDLPDDYNFIKLYQELAELEKQNHYIRNACTQLAGLFQNRRQYSKAADWWRKGFKNGVRNNGQVRQIEDNWGRFEPVMTQPAESGATVEYRFRNGKNVSFEAHAIKVEKLLGDVKRYLKSNPQQVKWQQTNIGNLGHRLVVENEKQYLGKRVASWELELKPRANHFDKRVTVNTPLQKGGAYLLTAKMADGNVSKIIIWVADTAIVKKPIKGKTYYFVADAVTGKPIPKANVEFFGWRQRHLGKRKFQVDTKNFAEFTDADGQVMPDPKQHVQGFQWVITARNKDGRFAFLGFTNVWHSNYHDQEYNQTKVFMITDRPVYRPEQKVHFKAWVRHAKYDNEDVSDFANQKFPIEIFNPKGEKVLTQTFETDAFGGLEGELDLPADATLGVYSIRLQRNRRRGVFGQGTFRVEEYKKPEFEVTIDAPTEPVQLGEKIEATINARYFFGAPVTEAKVKYTIHRTSHDQRWHPVAPWDWMYGRGYWWFSVDYPWYPGWGEWGCVAPSPWWWPVRHDPPEIVAEREVEIGEDGTIKIEIDTLPAKEIHGNQDHRYEITVEVVDASRRTIVGKGSVLVARKPFKVFTWLDRGYYRAGDTITAQFKAHTLDQKPVEGQGELQLFAISYDKDRNPVEQLVQKWDVDTNDEGSATHKMVAGKAGQYRLSYTLTDSKDHQIEGGYVFTIAGRGFDGSDFRYNALELIPQKKEFAPGETVKLMINTDRVDSTVLLFTRPANGVYLPPQVLRLKNKSTVVEIEVVKRDMPNFFVEAVTIADGRLHSVTKEIVVPPEKRVLGVEVLPSATNYKPGEKAKMQLRITGFDKKPLADASVVLAVYDKSLEYISGGTNIGDIKEFFWKWRRRHNARSETNLTRGGHNMTLPNKPGMNNLGVFGATVVDEVPGGDGRNQLSNARFKDGRLRSGRVGALSAAPGAALMESPDALVSADAEGVAFGGGGGSGGQGEEQKANAPAGAYVEAEVRKNFADTAFWAGALTTNHDGIAEVEFDMPENLTTWKVKAWGMGHGTRVGEGSTEVITSKDLIIRLQAPRFFVQKDEVVLSAVVHNYLDSAKRVRVALELDGGTIVPMVETSREVEVPAGGETRVNWRVKVVEEGEAIVRMKALTDEESDAMEMTFPVYVHGMLKMDSYAGVIRPDDKQGQFTINVPAERRPSQSRLEVRYSPTLAGAMVDALPYLADYPYGCTEQTLNRFLPTVITQKVLLDMDLDLKAIQEKRTNLNAQEIGDDQERAKQWKRFDRNPVFDEAEVRKMVKDGLSRLTQMQLSDGGWGWFSGYGEHSYPHTTAVVVHGLQVAQANDTAIVPGVLDRGITWLERYQNDQVMRLKNAESKTKPWKRFADNVDSLVYMVLVDAGKKNDAMRDFLYRDRTKLSVYALAMYGLALEKQGEADKLAMILRNLDQFLVEDDENQTAHLRLPGNQWWYWYGSENEAHAYYLKLLSRTDPKGRKASRLVKYLLNNRKHATYWNSTRDTALCIEAMADYLRASGEDKPDMVVEVWFDGKKQKEVKITSENLFDFDNKFVLTGDAIESGPHTVELRRRGKGPVYFNGYSTNFTLEDYITKAGLEIKVQRKYYKLTKVDKKIKVAGSRGQAVDQKVDKYERELLPNLAELKSGDLVEIELEIESKNDYEYVIFEDMKAAGFEPVDQRSGYGKSGMGAYVEFRDNRVAFFLRKLARGKHSVSYRMRAEIPGRFSALPTRAYAMYAPELKGNSDEIKLNIVD